MASNSYINTLRFANCSQGQGLLKIKLLLDRCLAFVHSANIDVFVDEIFRNQYKHWQIPNISVTFTFNNNVVSNENLSIRKLTFIGNYLMSSLYEIHQT